MSSGGSEYSAPQYQPFSIGRAVKDYIKFAPRLAELESSTLAPKMAASQFKLQQQYALPYAQLQKSIYDQLYPETAGLQEGLAAEAKTRLAAGLPKDIEDLYRENLRAEIGPNVGSPIGADYISRGLIGLREDYKRYYQNLALSVSGRVPMPQGGPSSFPGTPSGFDPSTSINAYAGTYAPYIGAQSNTYAAQLQQQGQGQYGMGQILGAVAGSLPFYLRG